MTDPSPTKQGSTSPGVRLRRRLLRAWRAMLEALRDAWIPPTVPFCKHGYGYGYCLDDVTCPHFDGA